MVKTFSGVYGQYKISKFQNNVQRLKVQWMSKKRKKRDYKQLSKMFKGSFELDSSPTTLKNETPNPIYLRILY